MTSYLDKEGLVRYHNNVANTFATKSDVISLSQRVEDLENGGSADLSDYYNKVETDSAIEVVASVTACAVNEIKNTIGAGDNLRISFDGTKNLSACTSIMDALKVLDEGVMSEELEAKADKATTLSGYGITDAYTQSDVDEILKNYYKKSDVDAKFASMQNAINELSSIIGVLGVLKISATGSDGSYTLDLLSTTGGGLPSGGSGTSTLNGSTLICGNANIVDNSLVLGGATINGNTLVL